MGVKYSVRMPNPVLTSSRKLFPQAAALGRAGAELVGMAPSSPSMGEVVAKRPEGVNIRGFNRLITPPPAFSRTLPIKGRERRP